MDDFTEKDMEEALRATASMIDRTEKAKEKFEQGTSQHTLQKNRLKALYIASALLSKRLMESDAVDCYTEEDLKNALAPITSLISKSEKSQAKLTRGTWQHTMLNNNLKALNIVLPLLTKALSEINAEIK
ncbi:hypothetical protein [Faecalicatena contorta]|uniref:Uncharacterized protein n=1 Tax=Faecalicatena contorta TaxID=39482 RepID=A0A315ZQR7_9FIRM|nr:hypothetical protein [Faecalicatena contorta]PWJ47649.1 hypothetical protein A8805_11718 [Faecalicatena contorta]SUQ15842.1 hypothetical protein SAMN05216529_11718 [Faecalicatena contorta]